MKVKVLRNLLYNGTFYKADEVFSMPDGVVAKYEAHKFVTRLLQDSKPETKTSVPNSLPPLTFDGKKKK